MLPGEGIPYPTVIYIRVHDATGESGRFAGRNKNLA